MNAGAAIASGDVVLFMHCDNRLSVTASQQIQAAFQQSDTAWGGFEQRIDASGFAYRWLERGNAFRARYQKLVYGDQGLFVSRELFTDVGGFPEVQLMEDFALSQRLSKISLPALLPGPISVSPRRWRQNGVLAQTTRNWFIATAYRAGVSPERLAKWYDA
jgi:rSAM/selenodomain-associated transferase 2